jgi:undecaprenyl-diphosphatase
MDLVWVLVLGVVQGVTEFLPVSSSGHLAVLQEVMGLEGPRLLMNVALHAGTLGSILAVYHADLRRLARGSAGALVPGRWGRGDGGTASEADREALRTGIGVVVATAVTVPVALGLERRVEHFNHEPFAVGGFLFITGALLVGARFLRAGGGAVGSRAAALVGLAQGLAVLPGISRSGVTIVAALIAGAGREQAVRFSFLAALPALVGAMVLEGGLDAAEVAARWPLYLAGAVVSFVVGWACLKLMISLTERGRLHVFAAYLLPLGLALMLLAR